MLSMVYADFLNILAFDTLDIRLLCDKGVKIGNQSSGGAAMAIRKRTWQAADGTERTAWVVDYKDAAGKRRLKTFKRQKDAARYRDEIAPQLRAGIHTPDSISKTIAEAAAAWLAHCEAEKLERSTIRQRQQHINLHINPFIGAVKLSQLTAPKVRTFIDDLRDAGRSVAMRQKVLTNVKTMLSYAQERGLVHADQGGAAVNDQDAEWLVPARRVSRDARRCAIPYRSPTAATGTKSLALAAIVHHRNFHRHAGQ